MITPNLKSRPGISMKILYVMTHFPYPADNGARADIWARMQAMHSLGCCVDAVIMEQKTPPTEAHVAEVRRFVNKVQFVARRPRSKCLLTTTPTFIARNGNLAELPLTETYDLAVMETEDTLPLCDNRALKAGHRVLRVHNDELAYMRDSVKTEESFLRRQFIRLEAMRMAAYSKDTYRRVDSLWFISHSECYRFKTTHRQFADKAVWLPPCVELGEEPKRSNSLKKRVLFVGNFYTPHNRYGLRWYVKHIHPLLLRDPDYELVIAGSTQGISAAQAFALEITGEKRCSVHVNLEDVSWLYGECAVFINPMHTGAGVKLKNIHAIAAGIPVVSTSVGNDGSGFVDMEHVRIADTPEVFACTIAELLADDDRRSQMALRAYRHLTECYNCEDNIRQLLSHLVVPRSHCSSSESVAALG